jgi:protein ImuA
MNAFANAARIFRQLPLTNHFVANTPSLQQSIASDDRAENLLASLPDSVWRANQMGISKSRVTASGYPLLDRELPNGGWPASMLIELLLSQNGIGELRLLAPVLSTLTQAGKTVILLAPPHIPFAPALTELGLDLKQILVIQADKPMDRIWAIEQSLKSASFGALLCWLPQARADHLRRLQLAAAGSDGLCFVLRPTAAQTEASPAPLRIVCHPSKSGGLSINIVKRRGPVFGQPIIVPLTLPIVLEKPLAQQVAVIPAIASVMSDKVVSTLTITHAVDRTQPAATAA